MPKTNGKRVGVGVFARFRPCSVDKHMRNSSHHTFEIMNGKSVTLSHKRSLHPNQLFHLDMIFRDTTTQQQMFEQVGEPIVRDVLHGYNGTIFAYGQTGSGKTHSLFGDMTDPNSTQRGIIPRACEQIFQHIQDGDEIEEVIIKCSFIEIYKEKLQDLLTPNTAKLKIRQNIDKSIYVQGMHEEYVSSFSDVFDLLQIGFRNRVVGSTLMNQQSSRSHCVLTLNIKQTLRNGAVKISKVNFADLAGSERIKKTGATGLLLEQAKSINLSLSTLGNVISALTTKKKGKHIPYRDSKLTFLLQDSLGGNTKTSLIVTCSSEKYNYEETLSTLRFATRAKQMTNKVTVNKQLSIKELQIVVEVYKQKLGVAHQVIGRLQKLIMLMRSPSYNAEQYGSTIDLYLKELSNLPVDASSTPDPNITLPKFNIHTQVTEDDTEQKENANDVASDAESSEISTESNTSTSERRTEVETIGIINNLHATIDAKDKEIERLDGEIRELRADGYTQKEKLQSLEKENDELKAKLSAISIQNEEAEEVKKDEMHADLEINRELQLQRMIDEQLKIINNMKSEKHHREHDQYQLMMWNDALQKKLGALSVPSADLKCNLSPKAIKSISSEWNEHSLSQIFAHQLSELRQVSTNAKTSVAVPFDKDLEATLDMDESQGDHINISEFKLRAQQTAMIVYNLQKKMSGFGDLSTSSEVTEVRVDLIDAALSSIRCLLDTSLRTKSELQDIHSNRSRHRPHLSDAEIQEISLLKEENRSLIRKLADMKQTWIAHLDMMMTPYGQQPPFQADGNDSGIGSPNIIQSSSSAFKFGRANKKNNKIVKGINKNQVIGNEGKFGIKNLIGYLSGALLHYFGQIAVLKGSLLVCNKRISLLNFDVSDKDWKKVYVVLTKSELLGYRSLMHAETDTKSPLFRFHLKRIVSVLRIEEVLSAMAISPKNTWDKTNNGHKYDGIYIITTMDDKYVFQAEGNLTREVWMKNIENCLM
eukprot:229893_1